MRSGRPGVRSGPVDVVATQGEYRRLGFSDDGLGDAPVEDRVTPVRPCVLTTMRSISFSSA
jgi:hypothetical protein